jgi:hypothetical protein
LITREFFVNGAEGPRIDKELVKELGKFTFPDSKKGLQIILQAFGFLYWSN